MGRNNDHVLQFVHCPKRSKYRESLLNRPMVAPPLAIVPLCDIGVIHQLFFPENNKQTITTYKH